MYLKNILLGGVCLFSSLAVVGQDVKKCLVLLKSDDTTILFPLDENPKIIINPGHRGLYDSLVFETENGQLSFFDLWELNKLEIQEYSGVDSPKTNSNPDVKIVGKELIVDTSVEDLPYSVSDMTGRVLASDNLPIGLSTISLSEYQSGIYIITVGKKSIKVRIR
ncbi:MAG: T9SS type A sorting domain-containing protein [Muribaculaceae bacterium]|nr:T9SS type A sorting domain-containing protein [Muribaculaceae bacterium]